MPETPDGTITYHGYNAVGPRASVVSPQTKAIEVIAATEATRVHEADGATGTAVPKSVTGRKTQRGAGRAAQNSESNHKDTTN